MAPLLTAATHSASSTPVGGNESALSANTLLAFAAVLFAAMQGTLVMESVDPCRISYKKWKLLVILEVLEVVVVVASEVLSFIDLRGAFRLRLEWLQWVPPFLLAIGLFELLIDVWWTLFMGVDSRMNWVPFSSVGYVEDKELYWVQLLIEVAPMTATAIFSLVLVGWRMRWWLVDEAVGGTIARQAANENGALSIGAICFCVVWGFILSLIPLLFVTFGDLRSYFSRDEQSYESVLGGFMGSWHPRKYFAKHPSQSPFGKNYEPKKEEIERYDKLYEIQYGKESTLSDEQKKRNLQTAQPHIGNAILRPDNSKVFDEGTNAMQVVILLVEHFTILPLQICVMTAVVQLHDKLDQPTFDALKELVDAVVVVALVELAIGLKSWLWGYAFVEVVHNNDRTLGEEPAEDEGKGCLRCC